MMLIHDFMVLQTARIFSQQNFEQKLDIYAKCTYVGIFNTVQMFFLVYLRELMVRFRTSVVTCTMIMMLQTMNKLIHTDIKRHTNS